MENNKKTPANKKILHNIEFSISRSHLVFVVAKHLSFSFPEISEKIDSVEFINELLESWIKKKGFTKKSFDTDRISEDTEKLEELLKVSNEIVLRNYPELQNS